MSERLVRISFLRGAALSVALGVAACGGSSKAPESPASDEAAASDAAAAEPEKPEETWGGEDAPAAEPKDAAAPAGTSADAAPSPGEPAPAPAAGGEAETRTTQVISEVVGKNRAKIRACYDNVQKKLPDLKGDLVLKFTLNAEGGVKSVEQDLEKSTIKNPEVAKCAIDELKTWKFPPSSRGMDTTVNYPFNFNPKK